MYFLDGIGGDGAIDGITNRKRFDGRAGGNVGVGGEGAIDVDGLDGGGGRYVGGQIAIDVKSTDRAFEAGGVDRAAGDDLAASAAGGAAVESVDAKLAWPSERATIHAARVHER